MYQQMLLLVCAMLLVVQLSSCQAAETILHPYVADINPAKAPAAEAAVPIKVSDENVGILLGCNSNSDKEVNVNPPETLVGILHC